MRELKITDIKQLKKYINRYLILKNLDVSLDTTISIFKQHFKNGMWIIFIKGIDEGHGEINLIYQPLWDEKKLHFTYEDSMGFVELIDSWKYGVAGSRKLFLLNKKEVQELQEKIFIDSL